MRRDILLVMDTTMHIGERIARLRDERSISQRELKRRTGINIWRIEEGWHTPNIATLEKIAKELDVPVLELLK